MTRTQLDTVTNDTHAKTIICTLTGTHTHTRIKACELSVLTHIDMQTMKYTVNLQYTNTQTDISPNYSIVSCPPIHTAHTLQGPQPPPPAELQIKIGSHLRQQHQSVTSACVFLPPSFSHLSGVTDAETEIFGSKIWKQTHGEKVTAAVMSDYSVKIDSATFEGTGNFTEMTQVWPVFNVGFKL